MTAPHFNRTMQRLNGLKFAPATLTTHYEALSDLRDDELDAAVTRAARECDEFPSPKMLRTFVDEYRGQVVVPEEDASRAHVLDEARTVALPDGTLLAVPREWRYYDEDCSDTGMRSYWCDTVPSVRFPWLTLMRCQRKNAHLGHEWVEVCRCADTNPAVLRKRARAQQVTRNTAER